jgi:hypothetical protein
VFSKIDPAPSGSNTKCPFAGFADAPEPPGSMAEVPTKLRQSSHAVGSRGNLWEPPVGTVSTAKGEMSVPTLLLSWCAVDLDAAMSWATIRAVVGSDQP